jgi:hypothetical protein
MWFRDLGCYNLELQKVRAGTSSQGSEKKERLRLGRLEHDTTQFSRGHRVLRSGGLNHINHRVHRVYP